MRNILSHQVDWTGESYGTVTLDWGYKNKHVPLSMPGYVEGDMHEYQHKNPTRPQHTPHIWERPDYGSKTE